MSRLLYLVTGAKGHLGNTIIRMLKKKGEQVRGLVLPDEWKEGEKDFYPGDVTDAGSMKSFFTIPDNMQAILIHTAGIIDISGEIQPRMYEVNVTGTENVIQQCRENGILRLIYVSSVHAIPETDKYHVLKETDHFDPNLVVGGYAKTKAEASQAVLNAAAAGMDCVVVQPSGILGPYDPSGNYLVQLIADYIHGRLPACVRGGYDFVDVRDVAAGCILASRYGQKGECYILSNRHYEVKDLLEMVRRVQGGRKLLTLPAGIAKAALPFLNWYAGVRKERPLYTSYALYTLRSNDRFSHDKATRQLHYQPRDLYHTIADTVKWEKSKNKIIPC